MSDRRGPPAGATRQIRPGTAGHWSLLLGQVSLWSFVVLIVTGVLLAGWYEPSMLEVAYQGSYAPMRGRHVSEAYASTMAISFDVRGGLLIRQTHHWAAMVFIGSMLLHLVRVFASGAFRKPREWNWVLGVLMLLLGTLQGFLGHSLPDDLLSGTGLRVTEGVVRSIPVVGTHASLLVFGGEFPGDQIISRLYVLHVLVVPVLLSVLTIAHLLLVRRHRPARSRGAGRNERNVAGSPTPVRAARAGGLFFIVFGVVALMGASLQINPIWTYGPYDPSLAGNGSQPDWYLAPVEGLLRIMPAWESRWSGHTIAWDIFIPGAVVPGLVIGVVLAYPFLEARITGDKRHHHLLQRPRDAATRTALLAAMITLYGLLWAAAGDDVLAFVFHLSVNQIVYFMRVAVFVGPLVAFLVTRRICLGLQRQDADRIRHGHPTGVVLRSAHGGYSETHRQVDDASAAPEVSP